MDLTEAKKRLSDAGRIAEAPAGRLLAFSVQGTIPGADTSLWATAVAPNGVLAEAGQVAEWAALYGPSVQSIYCTPLNGGVFISAIVN